MNLTFLPGPGMPTFVINYQSIGKNNEKTQLDSVGGKTVDLREDSNASTNMMAITVPFRSGDIKQNIVISTGGVSNLDNLNNKRINNIKIDNTSNPNANKEKVSI